jgi:hypothetical protein
MFQVTHLGHQSWLVKTEAAALLIDPLLCEHFGAEVAAGLRIYPPRRFDFASFPAVSAVLISHEHDDHFHVASLDVLDRRIPIYLSERASSAARAAVEEMGFATRRLRPEEPLHIADVEVVAVAPRLRPSDLVDEWDVLAIYVRQVEGHGSFFSTVDISALDVPLELLQRFGSPDVVAVTNNFNSPHLSLAGGAPVRATPALTAALREIEHIRDRWGQPKVLVGSGNGWSFSGSLEPLNRQVFPTDNGDLSTALAKSGIVPGTEILAGGPGTTVSMRDGRPENVGGAAFVRLEDEGAWPDRSYRPTVRTNKLATPLGRSPCSFSDEDAERLLVELNHLARWLVGTESFLHLNGLSSQELNGCRRGFVLALQTDWDGTGYALVYDPAESSFVVTDDAPERYVAGASCWASDLLSLFDLAVNPPAFTFGHYVEWWSGSPQVRPVSLLSALWLFLHPLRQPEKYLRAYRRHLAENGTVAGKTRVKYLPAAVARDV